MGLRTTWICVKGADRARMLKALNLVETGVREGPNVCPAAVAEMPGGWGVAHFGEGWRLTPEQAAAAFPDGEVVWGTQSDTVMWSGVYGLVDGRQVWSVEHDPENDLNGVQVEGPAPSQLDAIRARLLAEAAKADDEEVDYVYEAPMELTQAITGYDPKREVADQGFRVAEVRLRGAAGARQAADIALIQRLVQAVETRLVPAARELGFRRADEVEDPPLMWMTADTLVRMRDGLSETLDFEPGLYGGVAKIGMGFFVRRGSQGRAGSVGRAVVQPPKRGFLELFTGRKEEPADAAFERAVREALDLLPHVDRHLKEGTSHPHIRPASYYGQANS